MFKYFIFFFFELGIASLQEYFTHMQQRNHIGGMEVDDPEKPTELFFMQTVWFLTVTCSCCLYLYFGLPIMLVTYFS